MLCLEWLVLGFVQYIIQKFYCINGGSMQCKGVMLDIMMLIGNEDCEIGEQYEDNVLLWDSINVVIYVKFGDLILFGLELFKCYDECIVQDFEFQYIMKDIVCYNVMKDKCNIVFLNYVQCEKENEEDDVICLVWINDCLKCEGKLLLKKLDDLLKDYQELDLYFDEMVYIVVDLVYLEKVCLVVELLVSK